MLVRMHNSVNEIGEMTELSHNKGRKLTKIAWKAIRRSLGTGSPEVLVCVQEIEEWRVWYRML
jgi:hypothetical protein